jgi:peptide/nickel transport system substrate-binding protein
MKENKMMFRLRNLMVASVFLAGVSVAVAPNVSAAQSAGATTFTYDTYTQVMTSWDPSTDYSNEIIAMQEMYETLTHYNSQTKQVTPLLATSWSSSDEGKTWTFHLRHGVTFHTGRPLTAADAAASIQRTIKLNQGAAYIWSAVSSITAPSTYTLVIHCKYASPIDLISSSDYGAYIFDTQAAPTADLAKWFAAGHDAGTGPYTVESNTPNAEVALTLKEYPKYWAGWSGNHFTQVAFRVTPEASTAAQLVDQGQVSFVEQLTPQLWKAQVGQSSVQTTSNASWQNLLAFFNTASGPMANENFRKAVSSAINYQGFVAALQGGVVRTPGIIPAGLLGYNAQAPQYTYDLAKAKSYLKASGYSGKKESLTLTYTQGDAEEQLAAQLIQSELAPLGITLKVEALQWATQWAKAQAKAPSARQDIFLMYWWPDYADPFSWFTNLYLGEKTPYFNLSYFNNATMNAQIGRVEATLAVNKTAGAALYGTMQNEVYQYAPTTTLWTVNYQRVLSAGITGYTDNPAYPNVVFVYDLKP